MYFQSFVDRLADSLGIYRLDCNFQDRISGDMFQTWMLFFLLFPLVRAYAKNCYSAGSFFSPSLSSERTAYTSFSTELWTNCSVCVNDSQDRVVLSSCRRTAFLFLMDLLLMTLLLMICVFGTVSHDMSCTHPLKIFAELQLPSLAARYFQSTVPVTTEFVDETPVMEIRFDRRGSDRRPRT